MTRPQLDRAVTYTEKGKMQKESALNPFALKIHQEIALMRKFYSYKKNDKLLLYIQQHRRLLIGILVWIMIMSLIVFYPLVSRDVLRDNPGDSRGKLIWSDEFHGSPGTPPDPSKWTPDLGNEGTELEYYTNNQNIYQDGHGNLVIEARKGNPAKYRCWYGPCQYTSARITTRQRFGFTYGLLEARIKIPNGRGLWPTFWIVGNNIDTVGWPACGEIDVMENIGEDNIIYGTVHGPGQLSNNDISNGIQYSYVLPHGKFSDSYHDYAMQWSPGSISFFVDGKHYGTLTKAALTNPRDWVYDHPFHIILNLAVGGTWPGNPPPTAPFPQKMYIASVRLHSLANP